MLAVNHRSSTAELPGLTADAGTARDLTPPPQPNDEENRVKITVK